jgi:hypothetical protein
MYNLIVNYVVDYGTQDTIIERQVPLYRVMNKEKHIYQNAIRYLVNPKCSYCSKQFA